MPCQKVRPQVPDLGDRTAGERLKRLRSQMGREEKEQRANLISRERTSCIFESKLAVAAVGKSLKDRQQLDEKSQNMPFHSREISRRNMHGLTSE